MRCHKALTAFSDALQSAPLQQFYSFPASSETLHPIFASQPWHPCSPGAGTLSGADACTRGILRCQPQRLNLEPGQSRALDEIQLPIQATLNQSGPKTDTRSDGKDQACPIPHCIPEPSTVAGIL